MDATGTSTVGNKTFEDHKDNFLIKYPSTEAKGGEIIILLADFWPVSGKANIRTVCYLPEL